MKRKAFNKVAAFLLTAAFFTNILLSQTITAFAEVDYEAQMEERKLLPVQSNEIENWPEGPAIGAKAAILMEMNTQTILYSKNIHEQLYPASTTKIMTCLLASQNCDLGETVTFSHDAVFNVPSDGSNMGMDVGESITLEQAMYGVLVGSANEAASAVGEHIAGSEKAFAKMMNEKAASLGCENTNFVNANGLFDENHYTSAYDLALIGCEFFNNEILCKMSSTASYNIPPTANQPDDIWINSKNKLLVGKSNEYEYLLGSKTGFVSQSRQTLVSGAQKDGMKLVCVIFMEETPYQYEDTVTLFNYGFENFQRLMVTDYETDYAVDSMDLFDTENDLFGSSTPLMSMDRDSYIILPNTVDFTDAKSSLSYSDSKEADSNVIATIEYSYSGVPVGNCDIVFTKSELPAFDFDSAAENTADNKSDDASRNVIFVNVKKVILGILAVAGIIIFIFFLISVVNSYSFSARGRSRKRRIKRSQESKNAKRTARRNIRRQKKQLSKRKREARRRSR